MKAPLSEFKQEYLIALGRIVVNMNMLEMWTQNALAILLDSNFQYIFILFGTENYSKILEYLENAFNYKATNDEQKIKIKLMVSKLKLLNTKRNKYIHSLWLFSDHNSYVSRRKQLKQMKMEIDDTLTVDELNTLADELGIIHNELLTLVHEIAPVKINSEKQ
jgi:hypothetical protein